MNTTYGKGNDVMETRVPHTRSHFPAYGTAGDLHEYSKHDERADERKCKCRLCTRGGEREGERERACARKRTEGRREREMMDGFTPGASLSRSSDCFWLRTDQNCEVFKSGGKKHLNVVRMWNFDENRPWMFPGWTGWLKVQVGSVELPLLVMFHSKPVQERIVPGNILLLYHYTKTLLLFLSELYFFLAAVAPPAGCPGVSAGVTASCERGAAGVNPSLRAGVDDASYP